MAAFLSLADAKRWLDIDPAEDSRDDILQALIDAATDSAIQVMQRDPTSQSRDVVVSGFGGPTLPMNHYPIQSVESVTICPETGALPLDPATYTFDDNVIILRRGGFPLGRRNIGVSFTAGEPVFPPSITLAMRYTVKAMWDARKIDMNATGESFEGVGSSSFWPTGPGSVPPQAVALLMPFYNAVKV
jgi:hypothetical protein